VIFTALLVITIKIMLFKPLAKYAIYVTFAEFEK